MSWRVLMPVKIWLYVSFTFAILLCKGKTTMDEENPCSCANGCSVICCSSFVQVCAISTSKQSICGSIRDLCGNECCKTISKNCAGSSSNTAIDIHCQLPDGCTLICLNETSVSKPSTISNTFTSTFKTSRSSSPMANINITTSVRNIIEPESDQPTSKTEQQKQQTSKSLIIGVVVGGVLAIALLAGLILFIILRRRRLRFTSSKMDNAATASVEANVYGSQNFANRAPLAPYDNIGAPLAPYDNIGASPSHADGCRETTKIQPNQESGQSFSNIEEENDNDRATYYKEAMKISDNTRNADEAENQLSGGHAMKTFPAKSDENETILIENDLYQR